MASQNSLEISNASGHTNPLESEDDTTRGMVVRPSSPQGTQKLIFTDASNAGLGTYSG